MEQPINHMFSYLIYIVFKRPSLVYTLNQDPSCKNIVYTVNELFSFLVRCDCISRFSSPFLLFCLVYLRSNQRMKLHLHLLWVLCCLIGLMIHQINTKEFFIMTPIQNVWNIHLKICTEKYQMVNWFYIHVINWLYWL